MSKAAAQRLAPKVTVTYEKNAPVALMPGKTDPVQSAWGNGVANAITFTDPLVVTASPNTVTEPAKVEDAAETKDAPLTKTAAKTGTDESDVIEVEPELIAKTSGGPTDAVEAEGTGTDKAVEVAKVAAETDGEGDVSEEGDVFGEDVVKDEETGEEETSGGTELVASKTVVEKKEETPAGEGGGDGAADLSAWKTRVTGAIVSVPQPTLGNEPAAKVTVIAGAGKGAAARHKAAGGALAKEAEKAVRKPPETPKPIPPPPPTPVPEADKLIADASDKKLPDQELPVLERRPRDIWADEPEPTMPVLDVAFAEGMGSKIELPPPEPAPALAPGEKKPQGKEQLDKLKGAKAKAPEENRTAEPGEKMVLKDTAAPPAPAIETGTKGQSKEKVAQVLAELLRGPGAEGAAVEIISEARREAFPRNALQELAPTMGDDQKDPVLAELKAQVDSIRAIAGITQLELAAAIKTREETVKKLAEGTRIEIDSAKEGAKQETETAGGKTAEDIAGAREAIDQKTIETAIAANGEADPAVTELRRDKAIRDLTRRTARQDVFYEKAGERRATALADSYRRMHEAYKTAATADRKPIYDRMLAEEMKKAVPADKADKETKAAAEKQAQEAAKTRANAATAPIFEWAARKSDELRKTFGELKEKAAASTKQLRDTLKQALVSAKELLRAWAEERIARQESWWDSLMRLFDEWAKEAQDDSAAWEEARNEQLRDTLVADLALLDELTAVGRSGVDVVAHSATLGLDQAQAKIVNTYFKGSGPKGKEQLDAIGAVAEGMRIRVKLNRKPGLIEWFKNHVLSLDDSKWDLLGMLGNAENPAFSAKTITSDLRAAMKGVGTDEAKIFRALGGLTPVQARAVRAKYKTDYGRSLDSDLSSEMEDEELDRATAALTGDPVIAGVAALNEAMSGAGTDEATIMQVLRGKPADERAAIAAEYKRRFGRDLLADLKSELDDGFSSHHDFARATALMQGDVAKADAIALDDAMSGAGTDEPGIAAIYEQNRAEIEAEGARKGWSAKEMEEKLRERNKAIDEEYERKYGDPNKPTDQPSALSRAFESEMEDAELGLAKAFAKGDLTEIDSAKLAVEKESFITSDETVNNILASQAQRARRDVERETNLDLQFKAQVDEMRGDPWNAQKWENERKQATDTIEQKVKDRSMLYMSNLETAFDKDWGGGKGGLVLMLAFNLSGEDQQKAFELRSQGGMLTPEQEIYYAVNGVGTDLDKLKQVLKTKSKAEIEELEKVWAKKYPDEGPLRSRIMEEVSGNDAKEMEWGLEGAPQSPEEEMERARERKEYYKGAHGFWGDYEEEAAAIDQEYEALVTKSDKLKEIADLKKPWDQDKETEEQYLARRERYAFWEDAYSLQKGNLDRAIEDHEAAVNEFADTAATIAGIVAVVAVMVVAGLFTGGAASAAIGGALISAKVAAAAAVAGAVATIGTKWAIKGKAYGHEELAVDIVVGAVDAMASAMTAGIGGSLLKAARAGMTGSKLAGLAAKSRLAAGLSKMAASERVGARMFAGAMAEGIEGVASTLPSAFAGNVLDEKNWTRGNAFLNILQGTVIQTGIGAVVSGGVGGLTSIKKAVDPPKTGDILAKRGTPGERLVKWNAWQADNPGKPYKQFLEQLDAGLIAKDVDDSARKAMQRDLRRELLAEIPENQRRQFAKVPIEVMSDADFRRFARSESGQAVVIFRKGKPVVILREGADIKALREEGIHLVQSKDLKWAKKFKKLDEARLANWEKLPLDEQLALYRTKLDIEIDAQQRLLKSLDQQLGKVDDPALRKALLARRDAASKNLDNLARRLDEVDNFPAADKLKIARKELDPPQYLDQKPRLFSKLADEEQDALSGLKKGFKVEPPKVVRALAGEFDDGPALQAFSTAAANYDAAIKFGSNKNTALKGSVRGRVYLFVGQILDMAITSKEKAALMLKSALGFFKSVNVSTIAPFLKSAPGIYKEAYEGLEFVGDTLFDNLQRIAASGTYGKTKIARIADAVDHILDSAAPRQFKKADQFVREVRESVESWNTLQKQLHEIKELDQAGDAFRAGKELADRYQKEFDEKLAKLGGYGITDAKILDDIKADIKSVGKWDWKTFRVELGKTLAAPRSFTKLEQIITNLAGTKNWDAADIGPIRRWSDVMEQLHKELESKLDAPSLQTFFDDLSKRGSPFHKFFSGNNALDLSKGTPQQKLMLALGHFFGQFESGYNLGTYDKMRYFIRDAIIAATQDAPTPADRAGFIGRFLDVLRGFDNASVGEYYSAYRRTILTGPDDLPARGDFVGVHEIPDAARKLSLGQEGRMADGVVKVTKDLGPDGPFAGSRGLLEDKAGKSSNPKQAENYSNVFWASQKANIEESVKTGNPVKPPSIPTADGDHHFVSYFVEMAQAKKTAKAFDDKVYHPAIIITYLDEKGVLRIQPRELKQRADLIEAQKQWLKAQQAAQK